jgi:hypothetical protein
MLKNAASQLAEAVPVAGGVGCVFTQRNGTKRSVPVINL